MPFPFTCLEVNSLTPENVERVCRYAKRFKIRSIAYMGAEWQRYQFIDHSAWGVPPVDDAARDFMANYQDVIRAASEQVTACGLEFYLWRRELRLPLGFVDQYGVDWIDFENPELWELLRWNTRQLFQLFPKVTGIFLSCTGEQKAGEWITANGVGGELPLWKRFEKMFRTVREVCDELGRAVVFRNHGVADEGVPLRYDESTYMWHYLKAICELGSDTVLMGKAVEPDYQASYPLNTILGSMAQQQPTYMEFSLPMEYNAVGRTPFPMVEDIKMRLLKAQKMGCHGAVARIDWHMSQHQTVETWSCLDNFTEINAYAFCRLINEPGLPVKTILHDFAKERFGIEAVSAVVNIYKDLYEAGCKAYYEFGTKGCRTPSGAPLAPQAHLIALRKDHIVRWSFSPIDYAAQCRALEPDEHFIERVLAEKDDALSIYRRSLNILESARDCFQEDDYAAFHFSLTRAVDETRIRQVYMAAFFSWLAYHHSGEGQFWERAQHLLAELSPLLEKFIAVYDGLETPDPDAGDHFQFGANCHDSINDLRAELDADRVYWSSGESVGLQASPATDGAYEIASGLCILEIDPLAFALVSVKMKGGGDLLNEAISLACFRVGGLEESGLDVGRSFVTAQAKRITHDEIETVFKFGCQSCQYTFIANAKTRSIIVNCRLGRMPKGATVEFPWLSKLDGLEQLTVCDQTNPAAQISYGLWDGSMLDEISLTLKY